MRILTAVILATLLAGCTSLLLGTADSGDRDYPTERRSSSQMAADNAISEAIRQKLSADAAVNRYKIGISTIDSAVTLSGTVGSFAARDRVVQIATGTDGVRNVNNRIIVNTNLGTY